MEILPVITTLLIIAAILTIITIIISFVSFKRKEKNSISNEIKPKSQINKAAEPALKPQYISENLINNKNEKLAESDKVKKSNPSNIKASSNSNSKNRIEVVKNISPSKSTDKSKSNLPGSNSNKNNIGTNESNIIDRYSNEKNEEMFTPATKNSRDNKK